MRCLLIAVVLLNGCALRQSIIEDRIASHAPTCAKMGYKPDTDAFRDCQLRLYQAGEQGASVLIR